MEKQNKFNNSNFKFNLNSNLNLIWIKTLLLKYENQQICIKNSRISSTKYASFRRAI